MLQTVRELVANGVNGAEGLSSTEIAEYRDCGEKGNDLMKDYWNLDDYKIEEKGVNQ